MEEAKSRQSLVDAAAVRLLKSASEVERVAAAHTQLLARHEELHDSHYMAARELVDLREELACLRVSSQFEIKELQQRLAAAEAAAALARSDSAQLLKEQCLMREEQESFRAWMHATASKFRLDQPPPAQALTRRSSPPRSPASGADVQSREAHRSPKADEHTGPVLALRSQRWGRRNAATAAAAAAASDQRRVQGPPPQSSQPPQQQQLGLKPEPEPEPEPDPGRADPSGTQSPPQQLRLRGGMEAHEQIERAKIRLRALVRAEACAMSARTGGGAVRLDRRSVEAEVSTYSLALRLLALAHQVPLHCS